MASASAIPVMKRVREEKDLQAVSKTNYDAAEWLLHAMQERVKELRMSGVTTVKDPHFQTVTISAAGGSLVLGGAGGAFGLASGVFVGGAVGVLPALLTFGLSIPVGATIGGGAGLCTGTVIGAGSGALCGGAAGHGVFKYRVQIKDGLICIRTKSMDAATQTKLKTCEFIDEAKLCILSYKENAKTRVLDIYTSSKATMDTKLAIIKQRASEKSKKTREIIATPEFKVTAASATGGAVVGGTAGGATGTVVGGAVGAAVGVIPALFTFGLSIPVGAVIGGGIGCATGAVAGGSVGAVGGGTLGYKSFKNRTQIREKSSEAWNKVCDAKTKVSESLPAWRGASTGGSA